MSVSTGAGVHLAHCSYPMRTTVLTPPQQDLCVEAEKAELLISRSFIADGMVYCAGRRDGSHGEGWKVALNILIAPEAPYLFLV